MAKRLSDKQKREFIELYLKYRADGVMTIRKAYKAARMEMAFANKLSPSFRTLENWLRNGLDQDMSDGSDEAAALESAEAEVPETDPEAGEDPEAGGEEPEAAEDPEAAADYTYRLELMVRLYRRRSERDVDAVCDRLLPELAAEEE